MFDIELVNSSNNLLIVIGNKTDDGVSFSYMKENKAFDAFFSFSFFKSNFRIFDRIKYDLSICQRKRKIIHKRLANTLLRQTEIYVYIYFIRSEGNIPK